MAKKKVRQEEDDAEEEFGPPPFNEKEFYSSELELAKTTIAAALWGITIAFITAAIFALTNEFYIGLATGILAALVLKPLLDRLKIITRQLETMKWLGTFFTYFMCWVAFWVLLVNPPIMDLSPPQLRDRTPEYQELGSPIRLSVEVLENSGLSSLTAQITGPGGVQKLDGFEEVSLKFHQLSLGYNVSGEYNYIVRAEDSSGRSARLNGTLYVVPSERPTITLIAPSNGSDVALDSPIYLRVQDNALISGVYYRLDSDPEKIFLSYARGGYQSYRTDGIKDNIYKLRPNASGHRWSPGAHVIEVVAFDAAANQANQTYSFTLK